MLAILIAAGWVALAFTLLAAIWWIGKLFLDDPNEGEHERGWTVEELRAIAGSLPLAPVLAATAERLPFEEEYDAPARARDWARREYDTLTAQFPWIKDTSQ